MNDSQFLDLIETLDDMKSFTPEKLQKSLQGALETFQYVQSMIDSNDPAQKAEGIREAQEMRNALQVQAEKLCKTIGIDPSELKQLAESAEFSSQMKEVVESTEQELERAKPKKVKKQNKTRIAG